MRGSTDDGTRAFLWMAGCDAVAACLLIAAGTRYLKPPSVLMAGLIVVGVAMLIIPLGSEVLGRERHRMRHTRLRSLRGYLLLEYRAAMAASDMDREGWVFARERARVLHAALVQAYTTFGDPVPPEVPTPPERIGA